MPLAGAVLLAVPVLFKEALSLGVFLWVGFLYLLWVVLRAGAVKSFPFFSFSFVSLIKKLSSKFFYFYV